MNLVKVLIKLLNIKRWTFLSHFQLRIFNIYVSPHSLILCSQNQLVMQHFFKESKETKAFVSRQLSWLCSYVCSVPKLCLTLQPHGLQHARFPCHSLSPAICSHSYPLSRWCCLTISFSVIPFSCSQSFPATGPLPMNWLFASGGQSIRASASSSVLSSEYSGLISFRMSWFEILAVQETLESSPAPQFESIYILQHSAFFIVQFSHLYMTTGKTIALTIWTLVSKMIYLLFNTLSRFIIAFLLRSQVSFNFMAAVILSSDFVII